MKKILSYIKRDWKFILFVIVLFAILTIRLPYSIYAPGGKIDLSNRYKNEIYETKGSLNITYISAYPGTLPIIGLSYSNLIHSYLDEATVLESIPASCNVQEDTLLIL